MAATPDKTIVDVFWRRVRDTPESPAIMHKVQGQYTTVIWREHGLIVELAMAGLAKNGISAGAHVAILSHSNPKWTWADLAILSLGCVTVPIYPTLAIAEVDYLVRHSEVSCIFAEDESQLNKLLAVKNTPPNLKSIVLLSGSAPPSRDNLRIMTWDDLLKDGEIYLLAHKEELNNLRQAITPETLASIVYTSGTTGVPKGVMLHHRQIISVCQSIGERLDFSERDLVLSFLPLSHVYERVGGQFMSVFFGVTMAYAEGIETVPKNMVETRPSILNGVPRFYEKAYQRIQYEVRHLPKPQQILIKWAFGLNKRNSAKVVGAIKGSFEDRSTTAAERTNAEKGAESQKSLARQLHQAELRAADRLVFSKIRRRFGGRLRMMVSGAAPLPKDVQEFFDTIGLCIVEGYGLTESTAPLACNTPKENRVGTVGRPLTGVEAKIASDGELLVRGTTIFSGYYKDPDATREAFEDGWFKTGDIAEIDDEGYIRIKDRKKDIIITAGGKHVAPQFIENLFKGDPLISHCLVYGDKRKFISCLFTLHADAVKALATKHKIAGSDMDKLILEPAIIKEVEAAVNKRNDGLANFEKIKKFALLAKDFTIEDNELTPTFKVKRKLVTEKYKELLDGLYPPETGEP